MKEEKGVNFDIELTAADLKELAEQFKAEYKNQDRRRLPVMILKEQLMRRYQSSIPFLGQPACKRIPS